MTSEIIILPCGHEVELLYKDDECVQQTACACKKVKLKVKPLDHALKILMNKRILNEINLIRPS